MSNMTIKQAVLFHGCIDINIYIDYIMCHKSIPQRMTKVFHREGLVCRTYQ
jgi:hypothetical protein